MNKFAKKEDADKLCGIIDDNMNIECSSSNANLFNKITSETTSINSLISPQLTKNDVSLPLSFNNDGTGKEVLGFNLENKFAKYDVTFCEQFSVDNENYGLIKYDKSGTENKYINVDIIEDLFYDGKTYQPAGSTNIGLLKNYPKQNINFGLIGNKDITFESTDITFSVLGDNNFFNNTLNFINMDAELYLFNKYSLVKSNAKVLHLGDLQISPAVYDIAKFGNIITANLNNRTMGGAKATDNFLCFIDNTIGTKVDTLYLMGNNKQYTRIANSTTNNSGLIFIPSTIKYLKIDNHDSILYISKQKYKYTGINNNNTLALIEDISGNGLENITGINNEQSLSLPTYVVNNITSSTVSQIDELKHLELYNKTGVIWNTDTLQECFSDGAIYNPTNSTVETEKGLLENLPINALNNEIKVNLIGSKNIKLYASKDTKTITFSGDNRKYKPNVTIPDSTNTVVFNKINSFLNIISSKTSGLTYKFIGNNIGYNEIIEIPDNVDNVCFDRNSYVKVLNSNRLNYTFTGSNDFILDKSSKIKYLTLQSSKNNRTIVNIKSENNIPCTLSVNKVIGGSNCRLNIIPPSNIVYEKEG